MFFYFFSDLAVFRFLLSIKNKQNGLVTMLADAEFYYLTILLISTFTVFLTVKRQVARSHFKAL